MRKSWIAVGLITLVAGLAAGYRMGRNGRPHDAPASPAPEAEEASAPTASADRPTQRAADHALPSEPSSADSRERERPAGGTGTAGRQPIETAGTAAVSPKLAWPPSVVRAASQAAHASDAYRSSDKSVPPGVAPSAAAKPSAPAPSPAPHGTQPPVAPIGSARVLPPSYPPPEANPPKADPPPVDPNPKPPGDQDADRQPPTLQSLRFDPPEIQDGGMAVLSIGATDDFSGVKSVAGTMRSPSGAATIQFVAQDPGGSGVFGAPISIPHQAETGNWYVASLQILDKADNPLVLAYAGNTVPQGGALRVVSSQSDSTAPAVHRVSVDRGTVSGGDKNQVVVDIDDDNSGVASVAGAFQGPSKSSYIPFKCAQSGEGTWAGEMAIPSDAECGEWSLWQLRVADKANNSAVLTASSPELSRVGFLVVGGGACDPDPPVLDSVFISPTVVSNQADTVVVLTIAAHDDGSGVGTLTGRIEGPVVGGGEVPKLYFSSKPDPGNPDAPMVARVTVPVHAAPGVWHVTVVELTDKARNMHVYKANDPVLANAFFTVQ